MKTLTQATKAARAAANSRAHMDGMHDYKDSLSGRIYQSQKYMGPLGKRATRILPEYERKAKADATTTAGNIRAVEKWLAGEQSPAYEANAIRADYGLALDDDTGTVHGKEDDVFTVLKGRYPAAAFYLGWMDIYMSWKNRQPLRTEPLQIEAVKTTEAFAVDEAKPVYQVGDVVWCVHLDGEEYCASQAKILSWYVKELSGGRYDVMYELSAPCFGLRSGWKLQGNGTIWATREEADESAKERNGRMA